MKLEDVAESISAGGTPRRDVKEYWEKGDIPWLKISDLKSTYIEESEEKITKEGLQNSSAKLFSEGTVLFSIFATLGATAILSRASATNQAIAGIVPKKEIIDTKFLYYLLKAERSNIIAKKTHATQDNINLTILRKHEVSVPPLNTQVKIASILEKADTLKEWRKQADRLTQTYIEYIFIEKVDRQKFESFSIGELLTSHRLLMHKDGNHGSLYPRANDFGEYGVPFITAKNIDGNGEINDSQILRLCFQKAEKLKIGWIEKGDVLLSHNATVGRVGLYRGQFERALIGTSLTAFRPDPNFITGEYLFSVLSSKQFQRQLAKIMKQTTRNQVPITAQRKLTIPVPPINVQRAFTEVLTSLKQTRIFQQKSRKLIDQISDSLSKKLFNGDMNC